MTVAPSAREAQEQKRAARMATKKARTKALFDAAYDAGGGERGADKSQTYFDEWKAEMEVQAKVGEQPIICVNACCKTYSSVC